MTYAAIDIGTNTFRLLIASVPPGQENNNISFDEIHSERIVTRLGECLSENGLLQEKSMKRGIDAVRQFSKLIAKHKAEKILAIATSALRKARNSNEFITRVKDSTGLAINIIPGEKEAEITAAGMMIGRDAPSSIMLDIGGGSTELIYIGNNTKPVTCTIDLGVVYLAEKYMKSDPPSEVDLELLEKEVSLKLGPVTNILPDPIPEETIFLGTAGTITALAAAVQHLESYDHKKIHNFILNIKDVEKIYSEMSVLTIEKRRKLLPFEPSRLDIMVPGTLILLKLMQTTKFDNITVSDYGLLEGILAELFRSEQ